MEAVKDWLHDNPKMYEKVKVMVNERIAERFMEYKQKAVELLKNAEKLDELLVRVDEKFKSIPKVGEKLAYIPELALI